LRPGYDSLEPRTLLSTSKSAARAATAERANLLAPPAAQVAAAQGILVKEGGTAFSQYAANLSRLEQSSRVTPGQYTTLKYDSAQLDKAIEAADISSSQMQRQLFELQDVIDTSFVGGSFTTAQWSDLQHQMSNALRGTAVTSPMIPETLANAIPLSSVSSQLLRNTFTEMRVVGREAHVTRDEHKELVADEKALYAQLGAQINTSADAGTPRNSVQVYYDSQVLSFVHNKS
jgi:hypothetical protein